VPSTGAPTARPDDTPLAFTAPGAQAAASIAKAIDGKTLKADEAVATTFALPAAPPTPAAPAAADMPPVHAHVAPPVDSPAFAPALATQVRWLVRDGLQHAQLSLNPAEMGPVTVQIVLDGREARIDFRADLALTRNAIESSLPVLAAALDESGLRLAGGGVHDGQMSQHQHRAMAQDGARPGVAGRGTRPGRPRGLIRRAAHALARIRLRRSAARRPKGHAVAPSGPRGQRAKASVGA
jgi:flagellar hook-length control protein FliK